ncbi:hypothetical protein ACET6Z_15485 [Aeromonas veronii]
MSVFLVVASPLSAALAEERLQRVAVDTQKGIYRVSDMAWAVETADLLTPKDVVDKMLDEGEAPAGLVVFPLVAYWGFHSKELWAWLTSRGV